MATVYGSKVNKVWRAYMSYTVETTPTQVIVNITSGLNIPNDGYKTERSFTCTISGTGQPTVSGSISSKKRVGVLTKAIKSATYTWNRASIDQTVAIKTVLKGGGESTTSKRSETIYIPALAPATITFNANGGSGTVPSSINTYVGVANTIPSNSLTRTGYAFNGWNTASDGSGTAYATGSTITPSGNVTLYAQWKTTYVKPEIQNLLAFRTANASGGVSPTVTSTGKTGFCKFQLVGGANYTFTSATVQFGTATAKSMTKSGNTLYGYSTAGSIAQASAYTVTVTVIVKGTDGVSRTYTDSTYISKSVPVFDVSNDGNCIAFFGTAIDGLANKTLISNGELAFDTETSAAAARANLGLTGAETKTLLWQNARPTSEFGAQAVLNNPSGLLSEYDAIEVEFYNENVTVRVTKGKPSVELSPLFMIPNQHSRWADSRYIDFDDNEVFFENCWAGNTYDTGERTLQNAYLIPYKIYGIKEV